MEELKGNAALDFQREHLELVHWDPDTWIGCYKSKTDQSEWVMDYPFSDSHGGGPPRLRRMKWSDAKTEESE